MDEIISLDILYAHEEIPDELYAMVRDGLAKQLDRRLRDLSDPIEYLTALSWHGREQLSLLMVAALHGHDEVVRVLFAHCEPQYQVELEGRMIVDDENLLDGVTALYCACYRAYFTVARILLDLGQANVKHGTYDKPCYPLLIHASMIDRLDIVHFLVEKGYVDVNDKSDDHDKCTALLWAASRGHVSIAKYLLEKGAEVNYSCKVTSNFIATAPLQIAVLHGNLELVRILCDAGADTNAKNHIGDTLLVTAVERRHMSIIKFLLERSIGTVDEVELRFCFFVGSRSPIEHLHKMLEYLCIAVEHRRSRQIPKICPSPIAVYDYQQECQTIEELNSIKDDPNRIRIEVVLILERILLPQKDKRLIEALKDYGDYLAARDEFDKCLAVLIHAFHLSQQMQLHMGLYYFVWLFCKMITANKTIPVDHFVQVCRFTFDPLQINRTVGIIYQQISFIVVAAKILEQQTVTSEEQSAIYRWIIELCRQRQTTPTGQTIVHLCITGRNCGPRKWRFPDIKPYLKFPSQSGLSLLLTCGRRWLDLDAVESFKNNTALHLICRGSENRTIIKLLLDAGAHVDCVNRKGRTPMDYASHKRIKALLKSKLSPPRLKCLCARVIANQRLNTSELGPSTSMLNVFISLHGGFVTEVDNNRKNDGQHEIQSA